MNSRLLSIAVALAPCVALEASWSTSIPLLPGETYQQDFDGMVPFGVKGSKALSGGTLPEGWSLLGPTPGLGQYRVDDGRREATGYYSYGSKGAEDRSLGTLQGGWGRSSGLAFGAAFENTSALSLSGLQIELHGEEWRLGARGTSDRLLFQYSTDAHSLASGHWVSFDLLDVKAMNLSNPGAHDGNADANRQVLGALLPVSVAGGETIWIRWLDQGRNSHGGSRWMDICRVGRGSGLAVDDLSVTPQWLDGDMIPVPELGTWSAGAGLAGLALLGWLRRGCKLALERA